MMDFNSLTYWYPKLLAAGLPVPRTQIVQASRDALKDLYLCVFDGEPLTEASKAFFEELKAAVEQVGLPAFLRTGHTSAKHSWRDTCYLTRTQDLRRQVLGIVEFSEMVSLAGLPCDAWAVREFLPTKPLAVAPRFSDMPVCREFRFFVEDGTVRCRHPYWPAKALEQGGVERAEEIAAELARIQDPEPLEALASRAGAAVGGAWSVDILETERGWFVTDMAQAQASYHMPGCPNGSPAEPVPVSEEPQVPASLDPRYSEVSQQP